jgi:hypothetical protein
VQSEALSKIPVNHSIRSQADSGSSESDDDTVASRIGATVKKLKDGTRQPMTKTARNPMLEAPSVMGQRYFGQHQSFRVAMDSIFAKMIGVFPKPQQGAGVSAFNFSNMSQFTGAGGSGGGMQLTDALATMVMGGDTSTLASGSSPMAASINNLTSQIASLAGALPHSMIDLSRPDHAIPFMQAASQVFSGSEHTRIRWFGIFLFLSYCRRCAKVSNRPVRWVQ